MSEEWTTFKLKDLTSKIGSGATPLGGKRSYSETGISLIRSMNVYDYTFDYSELAKINDSQAKQLDNVEVEQNDLLLNITGASVGRCCMVPEDVLPARVNQHVSIIRTVQSRVSPFYLLYNINNPFNKMKIMNFAYGGATREALTKNIIEEFEIIVPTINTQKKIAGVLATFDELIEVNKRKIKILEQMAQALYKEWFVKMKFPGHEKFPPPIGSGDGRAPSRVIDSPLGSIPEGWEVDKLNNVCDLKWGDTSKTKTIYKVNGIYKVYSASGPDGLADYFDYDRKAVILSAIGANCGKTWLARGKWVCIKNTIRFWSTHLNISNEYLYLYTLKDKFWSIRGSAQPFITQGDADHLEILIPSKEVAIEFEEKVNNIYESIDYLNYYIKNLSSLRDLLLPKLISGKIDVSELDIDTFALGES